jgi:hypothetical protein
MNEHDRKNLEFLLAANDEIIADWRKHVEADDIVYAQELLMAYAGELRQKSIDILVEAQLEEDDEYLEANMVIQRLIDKK